MTTESTWGRITAEGLQRMRDRLGVCYYGVRHVGTVSVDAARTYALGMGERNPLYLDEDYGRRTRWGGILATPIFLFTVRSPTATNLGGLPGVHSFYAGSDWEYRRPVQPGDVVSATFRPHDIVEKSSRYAGKMAIQYAQTLYTDQRGNAVCRVIAWSIRTERRAAREAGAVKDVPKARYAPEELEAIWKAYDQEEVRGATPRYWEDVQEGDLLPTVVRGPLRRVEIIFGAGRFDIFSPGIGASPGGNHYYRWKAFREHLGFAEPDPETGVPDHPHRGHWEDAMARLIALPGVYDLAPQRMSWLGQVVTNWMGDDASLKRFRQELRRFNIEGDTSWVKGKVARKWADGADHLVEVEVWIDNQRGETTTVGTATVLLPSRARGGGSG